MLARIRSAGLLCLPLSLFTQHYLYNVHVCVCACACARTCVCMGMCVCMCVCMCMCVYVCSLLCCAVLLRAAPTADSPTQPTGE